MIFSANRWAAIFSIRCAGVLVPLARHHFSDERSSRDYLSGVALIIGGLLLRGRSWRG